MGAAHAESEGAVNECSSAKKGFHSHDAAMRSARQQMVKNRGLMLRVYRCEECREWHKTSIGNGKTLRESNYLRLRRQLDW